MIVIDKVISLLRFQLRVLSSYFRQGTKWNYPVFREFILYSAYYFSNFWYYLFLMTLEAFLLRNNKINTLDKKMAKVYLYENQFWVSLKEGFRLKSEKFSNLTYGETSYLAIKKSLEVVKLSANDVFYDLGCGTGKTVFFANLNYGCKAIGVDLIPDFINNANKLVKELDLKNVSFSQKSIFELNLKDGTVFYITPTCFDEENMQKLYKKFTTLPKNSRLIVLTKQINLPNLQLIDRKKLLYTWGIAETFYYQVV